MNWNNDKGKKQYFLLTGADGNLGGKLTKKIVDETQYGVVAVTSFPERLPEMIKRESVSNVDKIISLSSDEMFNMDLTEIGIIGCVHFAFSRAVFPNKDIASSLDYSMEAFEKMVHSRIQNCIYISSQSVYGDTPEIRTEITPPAPNSIYAMAKYAGEKLFELSYKNQDDLQHTIIRLDNVIQSQNLVVSLCRKAKAGMDLELVGGNQVFSYIDVSEVSSAIYALLISKCKWKKIYNVGPNEMRASLLDVAKAVQLVAEKYGQKIGIKLESDNRELWAGMNTVLFYNDTGWKPQLNLINMVENIYTCL